MIWFIGNIVWQVGHLGYQSKYDEASYNAKIEAIKSTTLGDAAELVASFVFSFVRDHFVQGALKYFVSGMLKSAFTRQMNHIIEQPTYKKTSQTKESSPHKQIPKEPIKLHIPWHDLDTEIKLLRSSFDNIETFNNFPIKFDYQHIFEWVWKKGSWKGFHHDWMGELEKQGKYTSKITEQTVDGFYKADITINGITITDKTFFPKHMTRQEVSQLVIDAISVAKHTAEYRDKSGLWIIEHRISPEVVLRIILKKSGYVKSYYPVITKGEK